MWGFRGEKIAAVQPGLPDKGAGRVIDASGKYVMPGVIDVHTHPVYEDDMGVSPSRPLTEERQP